MNPHFLDHARFNMVHQQINTWAVLDPQVLDVLAVVPREAFVPAAYAALAYADTEVPLGHGAHMLAPRIQAQALNALDMKAHEKVLEVGTGSGYMAALLAAHADVVWSLEMVPELAALARDTLARAAVNNVTVLEGDGLAGLPAQAPFDAIMVSGALPALPQDLLAQLKVGGRLFAIVGEFPAMQARLVVRQDAEQFISTTLFETSAAYLRAPAASAFSF